MKTTRRLLLRWYRENRRDLPWRRTRDPYAIWISEAMLQQTRVETVIPYFERFLERFPNVFALAGADADDLLGVWAGLGYYSRARNLQKAAKIVVEEHEGRLPGSAEALRELPGIGRYTAGAVASIAFDRPEAIVDGNVARVLARLLEIREDIKSPPTRQRLWDEAAALAQGPDPGDLNQALMELGATICTPRSPSCGVCPLRRRCAGLAAGDPESLPVKTRKAQPRAVEGVAGWVTRRGKALAVRRPPYGLLGGLWELPGGELSSKEAPEAGMLRALREGVGLRTAAAERLGSIDHTFSHRRLRLHVFRCDTAVGRVRLDGFDAHRWVAPTAVVELPHGAPTRKALGLLARSETSSI
ncbi:MAG: A/G-specific adenine glycosylase [Deltaproteobacteria bacterium]|nr:A/G-specific adenine glycosylase [Deltaproteobacteria bacterium]MBW2359957.1 A/G-specific adenine glycosylase [Deltaproteobacteria bacterium]